MNRIARTLASIPTVRAMCTTSNTEAMSNIACTMNGYYVANVLLDRPKNLNSLNMQMVRDLIKVYDGLLSDSNPTTCIIMEGTGRAFCAGGDVAAVRLGAIEGTTLPADF